MESELLRIHLKKSKTNLKEDCDIMMDQIRAIDNRRLLKKQGQVDTAVKHRIRENLKIVLDLDWGGTRANLAMTTGFNI